MLGRPPNERHTKRINKKELRRKYEKGGNFYSQRDQDIHSYIKQYAWESNQNTAKSLWKLKM